MKCNYSSMSLLQRYFQLNRHGRSCLDEQLHPTLNRGLIHASILVVIPSVVDGLPQQCALRLRCSWKTFDGSMQQTSSQFLHVVSNLGGNICDTLTHWWHPCCIRHFQIHFCLEIGVFWLPFHWNLFTVSNQALAWRRAGISFSNIG